MKVFVRRDCFVEEQDRNLIDDRVEDPAIFAEESAVEAFVDQLTAASF